MARHFWTEFIWYHHLWAVASGAYLATDITDFSPDPPPTAARIAAVTAALAAYTLLMTLPRGQIVNRSTLLKEVETDTADLLGQLSDLDDLILQFEAPTPANDSSSRGNTPAPSWTSATATAPKRQPRPRW